MYMLFYLAKRQLINNHDKAFSTHLYNSLSLLASWDTFAYKSYHFIG